MHVKKMIFLILGILFTGGTVLGVIYIIPLFVVGSQGHKATDANGLLFFAGMVLLVPTVVSAGLAALCLMFAFKKNAPPVASVPAPPAAPQDPRPPQPPASLPPPAPTD